MTDAHGPRQNHLIDAFSETEYERLFPHLELVPMPLGEVIYESWDKLRYSYFPTTCIVSLLYIMENGASTEVAVVGNEGMIGVALFMNGGTMPNRAVIVSGGYAYRLRVQLLMKEFERFGGRRSGALHHLLLRCIQSLITQMTQTAACNRHHSADQQFCRWLLLSLDITVPDRSVLEARVCECYQVVKTESDHLLPSLSVIAH
jgi:hypothetical protein